MIFFLGAVHVFVDVNSKDGNVYVKCPSVAIAHKCVQALHGRFFSGKVRLEFPVVYSISRISECKVVVICRKWLSTYSVLTTLVLAF